MTRNVGGADRTLRSIVGAVFVALSFFVDMPGWSMLAFAVGIAAVATAFLRYCPINTVLGRNSNRDASALR